MEVRLLALGDETLLGRAADGVFDHATVPALAAEFLSDPRHHIAAALEEGRVIGFASGVHYVHPDKPPELFVNEVGVAPAFQGHGIGKAVMAALLDHARGLGCVQAWVLTDAANGPANALYTATGGTAEEPPSILYNFSLSGPRP